MECRILIVDDDLDMCKLLEAQLRAVGFHTWFTTSPSEAFAKLASEDFDVVATDLNMPGMHGIELCERIVSNRPDIPVVVITGEASLETAVAAIRVGAYDYITKPIQIAALQLTLERAMRHRTLSTEVKRLRDAVTAVTQLDELIGGSAAMREVYDLVSRVAATDSSVLVTGESGTGKELIARALHQRSARRTGPFVAINCAALPETLLESELFGHAKGAFTDAKNARSGLFLKAHHGTLFLDEIGEMPVSFQAKLLRVLQERMVRPVGADAEVPFDVRIVAATNRDIEANVEEGRFRQDLFYRLNVVRVDLPPLRVRGNDVLLLAQHFVRHFAGLVGRAVDGISAAAAEKLLAYEWPGNVRELQNAIERAVALTRFAQLTVEDLPEKIRKYRPSQILLAADNVTELVPMEEVERRYVLRVIEAVGGNKALAARTLGFDRKTLYRKLIRYGLATEDDG